MRSAAVALVLALALALVASGTGALDARTGDVMARPDADHTAPAVVRAQPLQQPQPLAQQPRPLVIPAHIVLQPAAAQSIAAAPLASPAPPATPPPTPERPATPAPPPVQQPQQQPAQQPQALQPQQSAAIEADAEHQRLFTSWMQEHDKAYKPEHVHTRFNVWRENLKRVNAHNAAGNATYSLGMTKFADQTEAEFIESHACFLAAASSPEPPEREFALSGKAAPASVDWRDKGAVTPVRDQGNCGSCYTFSSAGAVEGAMALAGTPIAVLSTQQILDCSSRYGNAGCNGGLMTSSFSYVKTNKGLCADADYPYKGKVARCATTCSVAPGTALSGYTSVPKNQENSGMLGAVAQQPVAVAVAAGGIGWQLYRSGVMNNPRCGQQLDHAVLAVGYGTTESGVDYWIIKNSWGTSWGEKGYIRLIRGKNMCGVSNMASFPNVQLQK